eukprot:TRINITY_DN37855_c0_g1_i1.p1 TRINITY_DN37855_c0_g1~~TRINITY_DN37855_c0_g1_i1.p1  ORF type:complete len:632 (+),score=116.17 TRINITY_DN37855_c0_g1_i1:76-1896(+)
MNNKQEIRVVAEQCRWRGMVKSSGWLLSQLHGLTQERETFTPWQEGRGPLGGVDVTEHRKFLLAKAAFDNAEYLRAWHTLEGCKSLKVVFLQCYSRYLAGEEKRKMHIAYGEDQENVINPYCSEVLEEIQKLNKVDPYTLWLRGVTLRHLGRREEAVAAFVKSVEMQPLLWASWQELLVLGGALRGVEACQRLQYGKHWVIILATAKHYSTLHQWDRAVELLVPLGTQLGRAPAILQDIATARRHLRQWKKSKEVFEYLLDLHPYRFEGIVDYSNILFITRKAHLAELCQLARRAFSVARYRPETCMVLADYHSACERHDKAYTYYQRAIKLDPVSCKDSHVLMGHEAIELKQTGVAIIAYQKAVEAKQLPHCSEATRKHIGSGWYGLGMAYELMRLPCLTLQHYLRAVQQPSVTADQQPFWGGVAAMYEEMGMLDEAARCTNRRASTADTILHLARLARKQGNMPASADWYQMYLKAAGEHKPTDAHQEALLVVALNGYTQVKDGLAMGEPLADCLLETCQNAKEACDTITMNGSTVETLSSNARQNPATTFAPQQIYDTAEETAHALTKILIEHNIPCKEAFEAMTPKTEQLTGRETPGARKLF